MPESENRTTLTPDTPVQYLKGVGPKLAQRFEKLGIRTLADLLEHYPRRYLDFTHPYPPGEAPAGVECVVRAELLSKQGGRYVAGGRRVEKATAGDGVATLELTWFNNPYTIQKLELGQEYYFEGEVTGGLLRRQMTNPQVRRLPPDRGADQRGHRPVRSPAAAPRRAAGRAPAPCPAAEIPPARQGPGRAGHPYAPLLPGGAGGPAAADL